MKLRNAQEVIVASMVMAGREIMPDVTLVVEAERPSHL